MTDNTSGGKHEMPPDDRPATDAVDTEDVPAAGGIVIAAEPPIVDEPAAAPDDSEALIEPSDSVTCPECGTVGVVALTRRDATDFCRNCDYPLFWTPAQILLGSDRV